MRLSLIISTTVERMVVQSIWKHEHQACQACGMAVSGKSSLVWLQGGFVQSNLGGKHLQRVQKNLIKQSHPWQRGVGDSLAGGSRIVSKTVMTSSSRSDHLEMASNENTPRAL